MKKAFKYIVFLSAFALAVAFQSCSEDVINQPGMTGEGTLLNLYVGDISGPSTRLAELGGSGNINDDHHGKSNIGLYIYYEDDYSEGTLSKPYVRNLECEVVDGRIVPVDDSDIYIYDRMTIVAFYPYNGAAADYTFTSKNDEKRYSITESDYSQQHYIPYRAEANVNPTNAFYVNLTLHPVQTTKIQVVLVTSNPDDFPDATTQTNGVVKLVPGIDPQNNVEGATGDRRENWIDIVEQPYGSAPEPASSGLHVRRYSTYIWRNDGADDPHHGGPPNHNDNTIKKGDILLQSEKLTLFFPQDVNIQESYVYRYGYNIDTGEIFIPTSENLIHDAASLAAAGGGGYQVCDIDLDGMEWTPVNLVGTYDGGGHAVKNMTITQAPTTSANVGLFGSASGSSLIKNLELVDPKINVHFSGADETETLQVGALVGQLNRALTAEEIAEILKNQSISVPDGLPQSVIDALIAEMMQDYTGGNTSSIEGTKVSNPQITVTGNNVVVGGLVGSVGDGAEYIGEIKDSYVLGGKIAVNATDEETKITYDNAQAGAFAGLLNNGGIANSYTTATAEAYVGKEEGTPPVIISEEVAKGFTNVEDHDPALGIDQELIGNFTDDLKENTELGVGVAEFGPSSWPGWATYEDDWPVAASTLENYWGDLGEAPSTYPVLKWENRLDVKK